MVVCKFFLEGKCKFGENCRNEHPRNQPSSNRFAPLQNPGGRGRSGAFGQDTPKPDQYGVTTEDIKLDLTHINHDGNRPEWPLSAYAPGRNPPRQLIEGPLEISPEEMRVQCYLARATGKGDEYINQEKALLNQSQQQVLTILNDLEAAKNYVIDGRNQHPNRLDMEVKPTQNFPWVNRPGMNQQSQTQTGGGFGQPSSFGGGGGSSSGFGQPSSLAAPKPAFGATTTMGQGSAFGQSSALGSGSAFGKASSLGGSSSGGFGQPSQLGGGSTFGQASSMGASNPFGGASKPAAFGQTSQPSSSSGFGQSSQPSSSSGGFGQSSQPAFGQSGFGSAPKPAFGAPTQPAAFGQPAKAATPFGQPSQPSGFGNTQTGGSAFGQPSSFGAKPSPFASASQQQSQPSSTGGSAFGQPSAFGASKPSPFASAAQNSQSQQPSSSPFAKQGAFGSSSSGFGAASQPATSSPFGAPSQPSSTPAFGAPTQPAAPSGFGASSKPSGFGTTSSTGGGGFGSQPSAAPKPIPTTWNGHRVLQDGGLYYYEVPHPGQKDRHAKKRVRIWFPTGAPEAKDPTFAEAAPEVYEGQLGETLRSLYEFVAKEKAFKDGVMPEIPPKREWVTWDF